MSCVQGCNYKLTIGHIVHNNMNRMNEMEIIQNTVLEFAIVGYDEEGMKCQLVLLSGTKSWTFKVINNMNKTNRSLWV